MKPSAALERLSAKVAETERKLELLERKLGARLEETEIELQDLRQKREVTELAEKYGLKVKFK